MSSSQFSPAFVTLFTSTSMSDIGSSKLILSSTIQWSLLTVVSLRSPGAAMTPVKQQQGQQIYFSIANFSKKHQCRRVNTRMFLLGTDLSDFNLHFSSELCKRVHHLSPHITLLCGFGRPRIWTSGQVWMPYDLKG